MRHLILACALLLALPACSHHATTTGKSQVARPHRSSGDLLTIEDIESRNWSSVYEIVSTLRANWLNVRGSDTINGPQETVKVLLDGVPLGGIEQLHSQSVVGVQYIQYFDPISASGRWGLGFGKGAIYISMRRR